MVDKCESVAVGAEILSPTALMSLLMCALLSASALNRP